MSGWSSNNNMRRDIIASINKMFGKVEEGFEKVETVQINVEGKEIHIELVDLLKEKKEDCSKGTSKSLGYKSWSDD